MNPVKTSANPGGLGTGRGFGPFSGTWEMCKVTFTSNNQM
jgi:hypothetical protein